MIILNRNAIFCKLTEAVPAVDIIKWTFLEIKATNHFYLYPFVLGCKSRQVGKNFFVTMHRFINKNISEALKYQNISQEESSIADSQRDIMSCSVDCISVYVQLSYVSSHKLPQFILEKNNDCIQSYHSYEHYALRCKP